MGEPTPVGRAAGGGTAIDALAAACPVALATLDGAGVVRAWNDAAERLLGVGRDVAVGTPLAGVLSLPAQLAADLATWADLAPEPRARLAAGVSVLATGADGGPLPVRVAVTDGAAGGALAWLQAVDGHRPVADEHDDVFRVIFERAPEAITILDADLRQRTVNPAGLELVGLLPGMEEVGSGAVYVHPDDQRLLEDRARRRLDGGTVDHEPVRYRVWHTDGSWRWLESLSVDLRDVPPVSGFVVLSRDVTEAEEHRRALEEATERLAQVDRSRNQLLSAVSHELRTPLTAILSASEHLAADPVGPDELVAYARLIHRNAERLDAMVADLLLVGRLQTGTLPVELGPVDVGDVVARAAAAHQDPDAAPVITVVADGPPARADAGRLAQVVENLLANALKFGGPTGARVVALHDGDRWTITVSDRGPGIDPAEAERCFEPFHRGAATASTTAGSGLGLAIAKGIVDLHGGTIALRPAEGGGTEAVVTVACWTGDGDHVGELRRG